MDLIYEGSVKRLWQCPDDKNLLWFEFSDDYSIFDWGKMPDTIKNKGKALTFMGAFFFDLLADKNFWINLRNSAHLCRFPSEWLDKRWNHDVYSGPHGLAVRGVPHHFKRLASKSSTTVPPFSFEFGKENQLFMEALKAHVPTPAKKNVLGHEIYFYPQGTAHGARHDGLQLVPLEIVFRFGMPQGSSLKKRIQKDPGYVKELGLASQPEEGSWFDVPVLEFFTKLEPSDRLMSWSEASLMSGLSAEGFERLVELTLDVSLALYAFFADRGIELWDGKLEFVAAPGDHHSILSHLPHLTRTPDRKPVETILLADSIGPDELRLLYKGKHLSKELVRQIYKDSSWAKALSQAKELAKDNPGKGFKEICREDLKEQPQVIPGNLKVLVDQLYGVLANHLSDSSVFEDHPTLVQFIDNLESAMPSGSGNATPGAKASADSGATGGVTNTPRAGASEDAKNAGQKGGSSTPEKMKVLIVGGGGREHALAWKIAQSPLVEQVFCAPGNGGTALEAKCSNVDLSVMDFEGLVDFARSAAVSLTVIGPDNPLADGIVDQLESHGLAVFGPRRESAKLESSKSYAKEIMVKLGIPTARYETFTNKADALAFAKANDWARIVKVDGLALGKGVFVCDEVADVEQALAEIFDGGQFGDAASIVLLEERLKGEELSFFLLCDGKTVLTLAPSQDHKRRFDGDRGPNTGGMGAYSPVPLCETMSEEIERRISVPLKEALKSGKLQYKGVLFIGLMVDDGTPYVLEFNARFGDPETQAILPRLKSDIVPALIACTNGTLDSITLDWDKRYSCCVVAAADVYPGGSSRGEKITFGQLPADSFVFHAGTRTEGDTVVTNGGRVLSAIGLAKEAQEARDRAYEALASVKFKGMDYRKDIAGRVITQCHSR